MYFPSILETPQINTSKLQKRAYFYTAIINTLTLASVLTLIRCGESNLEKITDELQNKQKIETDYKIEEK